MTSARGANIKVIYESERAMEVKQAWNADDVRVEFDDENGLVQVMLRTTFDSFGLRMKFVEGGTNDVDSEVVFRGMERDGHCCTSECCEALPSPSPDVPAPEPPGCRASGWSEWNTSECEVSPYARGKSSTLVGSIASILDRRTKRQQTPRKALAILDGYEYCFPAPDAQRYRSKVKRNNDGSCSKLVELRAC